MTARLTVRGLRAWYGEAQVLHGVDLDLHAGEIVLLCGRNGSGRSTCAKALMGLVERAGSVRLDGQELIARPTFEIARRGLGYVAEQRDVFAELTVEENLLLGVKPRTAARAARRAVEAAFARFALLAQRRTTKAGALSGGEQQMLALARALLGEPRVLIVDEPTEGLAPRAVEQVMACLTALRDEGGAVLLIEQRLSIAREIASRVAVMGHGRIVATAREGLLEPGVVDEWLALGR